jgi:hypothetical protein
MLVALYKPTVRLFILAAARHFSQLAPSTRNELSSTQTNRNHLLAEKSNLDNPLPSTASRSVKVQINLNSRDVHYGFDTILHLQTLTE